MSSTGSGVSNLFLNVLLHGAKTDNDGNDDVLIKQLLSHIPDSMIYFNHSEDMPSRKEFLGVVLFADISGFTALTEKYSSMATSDGTSGTDKLSATLNAYIGKIVDEIIKRKGDVLKFAGDAILAIWKCSDIGHNAKSLLNKAINCSIDIQSTCDNFETEVGIVLRVKLAIAVGAMCLTNVGLPDTKQFDISGSAVDDVGATEKQATPGSIILSQLAWANCDQTLFSAQPLQKGRYFKVDGHAQQGKNTSKVENANNHNHVTNFLQNSERLVTSAFDDLIDQCRDYTQDMPKALLLDEDEKITTGRYLEKNIIAGNNDKEKRTKKFDRRTMTSNLSPHEVQNLRAYVPEPVLDKLDHGQDLEWLSEMRQVSVLFINMQLPTAPAQASTVLQKAFEVVYEACTKYEGNVNKVFGFDKGCTFVVIFGLPGQKHEDGPSRALKCAHHIFESLHAIQEIVWHNTEAEEEYKNKVEDMLSDITSRIDLLQNMLRGESGVPSIFRNESIGVTTGLAFCGVVGHKDRHEYTVIGSKVNMAARLMMYYPGILTCDAETYESAKKRLRKQDFIPQPYIELKGMKDPGVVREYNPNSSYKDENDAVIYPMLGREQEMNLWKSIIDKQKKESLNKSEVVVLEGDSGIGKTRLLTEFMEYAEKSHLRVVSVEGDVSQAESSYYTVNALLRSFFDLNGDERERYITAIINGDEDIREHMGLVSDIFSTLVSNTQKMYDISDNIRHEKQQQILTKLLSLLVADQSSVITIDNSRYIDEKSWEILEHWTSIVKTTFIFTIRTPMPKLCEAAVRMIANVDDKQYFRLTGLQKDHIPDLMCQLLEVNEVPKKLCEIIQTKSQGVPSWCEQLVNDMIDSNAIQFVIRSACVPFGERNLSPFEIPLIKTNDFPLKQATNEVEAMTEALNVAQSKGCKKSSISKPQGARVSNSFVYDECDYVKASKGVMPIETDEICIISHDIDLNKMLVPDSMKDVVLARIDRMTLNEQTILKCAAVLGQTFTRDLLNAIIPRNCVNMLDTTLYNLCKQKFFECGSLAIIASQQRNQSAYDIVHQENISASSKPQQLHHHYHSSMTGVHKHQVLCGCYAYEGYPVINLSQTNSFSDNKKRNCLYVQFSNSFVQEASYALWLEDQRRALHERAATYLEEQENKCRSCGGDGFIPGYGRGMCVSEQLKSGKSRKFSVASNQRSNSRSHSLLTDSRGVSFMQNTYEEALKLRKNATADHLKNYVPTGYLGESVGLALIQMARLLAQSKESFQAVSQKEFKPFNKRSSRVHPNGAVSALATRALLTEFRKTSILSGDNCFQKAQQKGNTFAETCNLDLSHCQCAEIQALVLPKLVYYLKAAGNLMKTFHYTIEAASAELNVNKSMKCFTLLEEVDEMIKHQEKQNYQDFIITDEERAKVECLKGQALCKMDSYDEGITHFHTSLKILKAPQPTSRFGVMVRTWKASLVRTLHKNMPGVFTDQKSEEVDLNVEQMRCLSFLSKAYHMKKDYDRAYLANLEQLNIAEEICEEFWNEIMGAYTDMITSCQIYENFNVGKIYEQMAKEKAKSASVNFEDMLTLGQFHMTCVSFHLANGDVNNALNAGTNCYKVANGITDFNMKLNVVPALAHVYLLKLRAQSCYEILNELKELTSKIDDHQMKSIYYSCCLDLMLDTGESVHPIEEIAQFAKSKEKERTDDFLNYLNMGLSLWYARYDEWNEAEIYYKDYKDWSTEKTNETFQSRFLAITAEYHLHKFRINASNETRKTAENSLKNFKNHMKCKGLYLARLYHLQAYFAYLKNKMNRAKLLLEDCVVASKDNDVSYDYEWAMSSKAVWFGKSGEEIDAENQVVTGASKYILPGVSI